MSSAPKGCITLYIYVCVCVHVLVLGTEAKLLVEGRGAEQPWMSFCFAWALAETANAHGCPERTHEPLSVSKQDEARHGMSMRRESGVEETEIRVEGH